MAGFDPLGLLNRSVEVEVGSFSFRGCVLAGCAEAAVVWKVCDRTSSLVVLLANRVDIV